MPVTFEGGARYTVPSTVDPAYVKDQLIIRFRVADVMKDRRVKLFLDGEEVSSRRRQVMAPGEMEQVKLTREMLDGHPDLSRIHISIEEV